MPVAAICTLLNQDAYKRESFAGWRLDYQVAAFGAYATILVESVSLILGGIEDASALSISLLTNGSAVIFAGFYWANAAPLAAIRIGLTAIFLVWSIATKPEKDSFDGTYAILCSCAHLVYQYIGGFNSDGDDVANYLQGRED